jgi:ATP-dependent RNA helicase RhlE
MQFSGLNLIEPLQRALAAEGYENPTPIQEKAIPPVLEGRDILGVAQTGTGKTAAFSLPLLQLLAAKKAEGRIRALVLSPTRELASQIGERIGAYGKHLGLRHVVIFGGVSQFHQVKAMKPLPAIVVATPGRLLDLYKQRLIDLSQVEVLILDEADRMLDMGFIHDVKRIVALTPSSRQTLFFSATMPPDITQLAKNILKEPVRVDVAPAARTADTIGQTVYFVSKSNKKLLLEDVLSDPSIDRALVFSRTKHGASRIATQLTRAGIEANAIHGDKTQGARERALGEFRDGTTRILVATDIAARGIDVDGVSHVVNFDLPEVPESYVHRIGRTGRAGKTGVALSFCDFDERELLRAIERLIGKKVPVVDHAFTQGADIPGPPKVQQQRGGRGNQQPRQGGGDRAHGGDRPQGGGQRSKASRGQERSPGSAYGPRAKASFGQNRPQQSSAPTSGGGQSPQQLPARPSGGGGGGSRRGARRYNGSVGS